MATAWYATREQCKAALDAAITTRDDARVDRAIAGATQNIEGWLVRRFYPQVATRYFDWPINGQYARPWRLWLDYDELISATSIVTGGITLDPSQYYLEPNRLGPPYNRLEINLGTTASFNVAATYQRSIGITGLWGYGADETPAGALSASSVDASQTAMTVTDSAKVGVGTILRCDTERWIVTDKTMTTTAQTLQADLTASVADNAVHVTAGTGYTIGEVLLLDAERMLIVDIASNILTVKRAWDGSVLAIHSGSTIYAPRLCTITRGALGTTAATHAASAPLAAHVVPGLVNTLCVAETVVTITREIGGYTRTVTRGEAGSEAKGSAVDIDDLRQRVFTAYGRQARIRAV